MKLHYVVGSPNCRKVHCVINHLNLDVEFAYLDFFNGDLEKEEFLNINPNKKVPALSDGSFQLWESNAIMQYLADTAPENSLYPKNPQVRADIARWQYWELAHYNQALGTVAFESVLKPKFNIGESNQSLIDNGVENLAVYAAVLDAHLSKRDFLVGNQVTLADYSLICIEAFKDAIPFDWSDYKNLNAYYQRISSQPQWQDTAPVSPEAVGHVPEIA
ncbi:hypothetical protein MNBD_GAMMA12-3331 [hydrothermal vent metagenome]|uniref:Glutathione S-transferase n=1 Tax=hydrothermal vent metagenome TaxID=652676 RepID=A0A3B0Y0T2_9ZZZZ